MNWQRLEVFLEFLIFGIIFGVVEDLIAVNVVTGQQITPRTVGIVIIIAIPFALVGEILVDQIDFTKILKRIFGRKNEGNQPGEESYPQN